jgi:hypothetical protein
MRPRSPGTGNLVAGAGAPAAFSPHYAFVVQFRSHDVKIGGRVEHMSSGNATHFGDQNELFQFFRRILGRAESALRRAGKRQSN